MSEAVALMKKAAREQLASSATYARSRGLTPEAWMSLDDVVVFARANGVMNELKHIVPLVWSRAKR